MIRFGAQWADAQKVYEKRARKKKVCYKKMIKQVYDKNRRDWNNYRKKLWQSDIPAEGLAYWKTLISGDKTAGHAFTLGFAEIPPYEKLVRHEHSQSEVYIILNGTGTIIIEDEHRTVNPRSEILIPINAKHAIVNRGPSPLLFLYAFPVDSFQDIKYVEDTYRKYIQFSEEFKMNA